MSTVQLVAMAVLALVVLGGLFWLLYSAFPIGAIYRSKTHLEQAFDSFDDPLAVIDSTYTIRRINRAYAALIAKPYTSILGQRCHEILRGRDTPCSDCRLMDTLRDRKRAAIARSPHPSSADNAAISFTFFPFAGESADPCAVEHIRDITELENLRDGLQAKNSELERTSEELRQAQSTIMTEIDMAREVQQGMLAKGAPAIDGLRIDVVYQPVESVGGDIYDFVRFSPTRLGVFIGDASGHGLPAAFVSTMSKMSLFHHTRTEVAPSELMQRLNADIASNIRTSHYLTCYWCLYDSTTSTLRYARAGHPRPIVVHSDGSREELDSAGTLIGILEDIEFTEATYQCRKGDRVYLFTDGVYAPPVNDNRSSAHSTEPFNRLLTHCARLPFDKILPTIREELGKLEREDDYTVIVMEAT